MVEVNCETDFVARTQDFKTLTYDIAMQIAAMSPKFTSVEELTEDDYTQLEKDFGDRDTGVKATVLLEQAFIKDPKKSINDLVKEGIAKLGENIVVRRFARFELGQSGADGEGEA
jgi:elongation factor Ts